MHGLETLITLNARAAGREMGLADTDGNDQLAEAIHRAATEHPTEPEQFGPADDETLVILGLAEPKYPMLGGPDLNDETYLEFTTGYLNARKDG